MTDAPGQELATDGRANANVYREAFHKFVEHHDEERILPIIAWIDQTGTSYNLRYPAQPLPPACPSRAPATY